MKDESKFHELLGRALTDDTFLDMLLDTGQQEEALRSIGIDATGEVLESLNLAIGALNGLKVQFGPGPAAA